MNRQELKNILQSAYDRDLWISTLQFITGKRDFLTVQLSPREIEIHTQEADRLVKTFHQIASVKTSDGVSLPVFEIILENHIKIEHNRVGVNEFIKNYIIKDAVRGALVTFSYDKNHEKTEWRFSFISKNTASDFFAEAETQETNPKKYTYIFGNEEEHRTASERLYNLEQSRFRLDDFFEAFNVEPVSKKFFEEYKHLYREFSDFIIETPEYYQLFVDAKDETAKPEKEIRNFVGRLLGRIVFLYFLQKKNWLGASDENYKDGSTTFLSDLFLNDVENQNDFYQKYLCPIFFNALNNPDRENSKFALENGETVCIPFLNGGLFEEEQEPKNHRTIQFPAHQFKMMFDFFNGFNFTVYENSPEEHTVAVDPEMLGHIFENLIDYNKDTGTFYTPKEIVQYMTQESLVEYLNTHLEKERSGIENLIKNQSSADFEDADLVKIDELLDAVKICDPAIGSGAFPMGMLQEIFNLKALIAYQLKKEFNPAETKQNIIQNSIYGVDLDEGAVEIARLRFWLSLVVDEGMPKALPNLDYKIMQGNSLLESYKGIDLSGVSSGNDLKIIEEMQTDLFGNLTDNQMKITVGKSGLAEEIQKLIKKYFTAKSAEKQKIKAKIQSKIGEHIRFNLELRENQLYRQIYELEQNLKNLKPNQKKTLEKYKAETEILEQTKLDLIKEQAKDEKSYFLWHLFFGDVLNNGGFDIVIGNPPYVDSESMVKNDSIIREEIKNKYDTTKGNWDLFIPFIESGLNKCKTNGSLNYIIPNKLISVNYTSHLREFLLNNEIIEIVDYSNINVFSQANVYPIICFVNKNTQNKRDIKMSVMENIREVSYSNLISREMFYSDINWSKYFFNNNELNILREVEKYDRLSNFSSNITISSAATVGEAYEIKNYLIDHENINQDYKKFINTGTIDKYCSLWGVKDTQYIKDKYKFPVIEKNHIDEINKNRLLQADKAKLIIAGMSKDFECYLDVNGEYLAGKSTSIIVDEISNLKYIQALLNSKLYSLYVSLTFHSLKMAGDYLNISSDMLKKLPISNTENEIKFTLEKLVDIVTFIYSHKEKITDIIQNAHISSFFQELIDAVIFEVYFPEEMKDKNVLVIEQIEEILTKLYKKDFNELEKVNKIQLISDLYFAFKESEVQQKMRQFVTASPDVLRVLLQS